MDGVAPSPIRSDAARVAMFVALVFFAAPIFAQQPTAAQASAIRQSCRGDYGAVCAGVPTGGQAALACLTQHAAETSAACQQALRAVGGKASAAAHTPPAARVPVPAPATASSADPTVWPHTVVREDGTATVYQPQVVSWPQRRTLNTRIALAITAGGAAQPVLGTIEVAFTTDADLATRMVALSEPKLLSSRFPAVDTVRAEKIEERIKATLAGLGTTFVPLDMILLSLQQESEKPAEVPVQNEPPIIFVSTRPASLVVFDGEPIWTPVAGTPLSYAVNTNWDVFTDADTKRSYLLVNGGWLVAADVKGPWTPAGKLPPAFAALPVDANFAAVRKQIPGRAIAPADAPTIFVSTTPAAIIVSAGAPRYVSISGTSLSYADNTDAALFRDNATGRLYYLVSGRWFSAATLAGPWSFATSSLPADFARIPANGPRGFVLVSVPGTAQAQAALIQAQIPQQGTLDRARATVTITYAAEPKFEPIAGTSMRYAVNTSYAVIQVGDSYLTAWQGAWFTAPTPNGPWVLATSVPRVIYTIPPSSPLYPVTYLTVVSATPTTVTYSYTSGYTMSYVTAGVIVYGTGYYYPPYYYPAPIPIYYPYPYSYSGATYYNPATGAWAQGGAIYGPYGGVAKAGYAYNPTTGAWAGGGAIYGPNGGAGAFSAYNPSTGSYAHGSAAWGPDGASANASWYNANTGRSGSTQQNSNAYGRWGSSTISGPNQTVHTQSQSNAQGRAGSFSSSSGAKGAGASGAGGNRGGVVKTSGGDVYAGVDGNVYKKTDDGWQKYVDGSWNNVQKPSSATSQRSASATSAPGATQAGSTHTATQADLSGSTQSRAAQTGGARFEGQDQLDQDRQARTMGAQRQQQYGAMRRGESAGRSGGGHFRR
jgi:hypothetical protein